MDLGTISEHRTCWLHNVESRRTHTKSSYSSTSTVQSLDMDEGCSIASFLPIGSISGLIIEFRAVNGGRLMCWKEGGLGVEGGSRS